MDNAEPQPPAKDSSPAQVNEMKTESALMKRIQKILKRLENFTGSKTKAKLVFASLVISLPILIIVILSSFFQRPPQQPVAPPPIKIQPTPTTTIPTIRPTIPPTDTDKLLEKINQFNPVPFDLIPPEIDLQIGL